MKRIPEIVLVLGAGLSILGGLVYWLEVNLWYLTFLQFGLAYLAVGAVARFERTRGELTRSRLVALLSLPALATLGFVSVLLATGTSVSDLHPFLWSSWFAAIWLVPAFAVPLTYAMGRAPRDGYAWAFAASTALFLVVPVAYLVATVPLEHLFLEFRMIAIIVGLSFWGSILPYELGRAARDASPPGSVRSRPVLLATLIAATVLTITGAVSVGVPRNEGTMLLGVIVYGPVLFLLARGLVSGLSVRA